MNVADANQLLQGFDWHNPSWDLFILLFWVVASLFYAFAAGRGRIISLLFSLYIAKLFVLQAPWLTASLDKNLPGMLVGWQQMVSFLLIFILLFVLLSRYAFRTSTDSRHLSSIPFTIIFAFLQIGLLISTVLQYLANSGRGFSPLITFIFLAGPAGFIWLLLPLAFIILLGRTIADPTDI